MSRQKPAVRRGRAAAGVALGAVCASVLFAAPASAAPTARFADGTLTITGDAGGNGLVVGQTPAGIVTLNGRVLADVNVSVADIQLVRMAGGAGDDVLQLDERNGVMPAADFDGGPGRDFLVGGSHADTLVGGDGDGIDRSDGGPGDDTVTLGDGADQFTWNPGDGSDHVDGNGGTDTLIFNGSDRAPVEGQLFETENLSFATVGPRTTIRRALTRQLPLPSEVDTFSFSGFEQVKTPLAGGPNKVSFAASFASSDISVVRVDLGPPGTRPFDPRQGQDTRNSTSFEGSAGPDRIRILGSPDTGAVVTGLGPGVLLARPQLISIDANEGDDVIDAARLGAGTVENLTEIGGSLQTDLGKDILLGHPGSDSLFGGPGDDRLEGRGGQDELDGGPGNNVIIP